MFECSKLFLISRFNFIAPCTLLLHPLIPLRGNAACRNTWELQLHKLFSKSLASAEIRIPDH